MQRKYIHYGHPEIAGLYYRDGNVYFENLDSNVGKMIIVVFPEKGRRMHNEQGRIKAMHHADG